MAIKYQIVRRRTVYDDADHSRKTVEQVAQDADGKPIEFASEDKAGAAIGIYNMSDPVWNYSVVARKDG